MINYRLLQDSIDFYETKGFKRIETPWTVSEQIENITKPVDKIAYQLKHNNKCLVGSGEQSFLYLYLKGFLPLGEYQTVTPCFRDESFDFLHSKYFIKNELIKTDNTSRDGLLKLVNKAYEFFTQFFPSGSVHIIDKSGETTPIPFSLETVEVHSFDIEVNGRELGSYGIRECEFLKWIYGTGCAEPRLSNLIKLCYHGIPQERNI